MASPLSYLALLVVWIAVLWLGLDYAGRTRQPPAAVPATRVPWDEFFAANILPALPVTDEFDTPLRPPDGDGAVVTLPFREEDHLGEDWTTAPGDDALGEPVYSIADGWVSVARDFGDQWGKVVFICYRLPAGRYPPFVEVTYAMLKTADVASGQFVKRGQKIGTMGKGIYHAHLHWEVRQTVGLGIGPGFSAQRDGWLAPGEFLAAHRGDRFQQPLLPKVLAPAERTGWGSEDY